MDQILALKGNGGIFLQVILSFNLLLLLYMHEALYLSLFLAKLHECNNAVACWLYSITCTIADSENRYVLQLKFIR